MATFFHSLMMRIKVRRKYLKSVKLSCVLERIFPVFPPDSIRAVMGDVSAELDTAVPRHELLDNTAAKHKTDLVHR